MSRGVTAGGAGTPSPLASPVLDLVMPDGSKVWHVLAGSAIDARSVCGVALSWSGSRLERGFDSRVVAFQGRAVCVKCRRRRNA